MAHRFDICCFEIIEAKASDFLAIGFGGSDEMTIETVQDGLFDGFTYIEMGGGQYLVCDNCNSEVKKDETCYYVAVLNRVLCHECFCEWLKHARAYPEDAQIEQKNYNHTQVALLSEGLWNPDEKSDFKLL